MGYVGPFPITVADGGTGDATLTGVVTGNGTSAMTASTVTQHGVVVGGASNAVTSTAVGTTGQILTGNTGADPTWQSPAASSITIDGDSGAATGSTITFNANSNCGSSVVFSASGSTVDLQLQDSNSNMIVGMNAGNGSITGLRNTGFGQFSLSRITSGSDNTILSRYSSLGSTITSGSSNVSVGESALSGLITGSNNTAIGVSAGSNYTGAEDSNILIKNIGTTGESHAIHIGTQGSGGGQQNTCFIAGITGVSVSNLNVVTINTSTGQLGSQAATSGTVTSVSGTANQVAVANGTTTPVISLIGPYTPATYTAHGVLIGEGTSSIAALAAGSAGQVLQSGGASADPAYSTATYPATATGTGTILRADGTNWAATTATYPNSTTSQQILYSTAANVVGQLTTANSALAATNSSGTLAMRLFSVVRQVFTSTGTYTPTAGMLYCDIEVLGGGGGGGGCTGGATGVSAAGGGGGGGYAKKVVSASTIGASQSVTIGNGGTGGASGNNTGTTGGTSSVGAIVSATGGVGGTGAGSSAATAVNFSAGGGGGSGSSGDLNATGATGTTSIFFLQVATIGYSFSGAGANSIYGGGGLPITLSATASTAGNVGSVYGSGGSGAAQFQNASGSAGGTGGKGIVIVTEYVIA